MEDRAELLRRRIALYRRALEEGVASELAAEYLLTMKEDEAELRRLEDRTVRAPEAAGGKAPRP